MWAEIASPTAPKEKSEPPPTSFRPHTVVRVGVADFGSAKLLSRRTRGLQSGLDFRSFVGLFSGGERWQGRLGTLPRRMARVNSS